jgi:hypothetical protein
MQAIAYGIHAAPNPHNTQAWKFKLTSDTEALFTSMSGGCCP